MWPALLLLLGSTILKHKNEQDAYDRANKYRGAMEAYQRGKAAEGTAATEKFLSSEPAAVRGKELADITGARQASLADTVAAAGGATPRPQLAGATSSDYGRAQDVAAQTISDRTKRAIEQLSIMSAHGERGIQQGIRYGQAAGKVDSANTGIESVGRGYMGDIGNVRPNPSTDLLANLGMAAGGAMLGGWQGAAAGTAVDNSGTKQIGPYGEAGGTYQRQNRRPTYTQRLNSGIWTTR